MAANLDQGEPSDRPIHAAHQEALSRLCAIATLTSRTGPSDARVESSTGQLPIALGQLVGRESLARYEQILTEALRPPHGHPRLAVRKLLSRRR